MDLFDTVSMVWATGREVADAVVRLDGHSSSQGGQRYSLDSPSIGENTHKDTVDTSLVFLVAAKNALLLCVRHPSMPANVFAGKYHARAA